MQAKLLQGHSRIDKIGWERRKFARKPHDFKRRESASGPQTDSSCHWTEKLPCLSWERKFVQANE